MLGSSIKHVFLISGICLINCLYHSRATAQIPKDKIYAVFLMNFTRVIEWPGEENSNEFVIGVLDDSQLATELKIVAQRRTGGKQKIKIEEYEAMNQIGSCHILFIPQSKSSYITRIVDKFPSNSMLIVTEKEGMAKVGSNINFLIVDHKIRFELNERTLKERGLKPSPELHSTGILVE